MFMYPWVHFILEGLKVRCYVEEWHMFKMFNRVSIMFMKGTMKVVDHVIELLVCQKVIQMPTWFWNLRCQMQDIE